MNVVNISPCSLSFLNHNLFDDDEYNIITEIYYLLYLSIYNVTQIPNCNRSYKMFEGILNIEQENAYNVGVASFSGAIFLFARGM